MKIPATQNNVAALPPTPSRESVSPVSESSATPKEAEGPAVEEFSLTSQESDKKEKSKPEPVEQLSARQLIEIQGNPEATAQNAASVARELMPPTNPYPSVQDLATVKKAQAMEAAARDQMQEGDYEGVDRHV